MVAALLPVNPESPAALKPAVEELFATNAGLADSLSTLLTDSLSSVLPDRAWLLQLANQHGLPADQLDAVIRAVEAPRSAAVQQIRADISKLTTQQLTVRPPPGLKPAKPTVPSPGPSPKIRTVKVGPRSDQRKRDAGDEAERWAVAALVGQLVGLSIDDRRTAIGAISLLLESFEGEVVEAAKAHALPACDDHLDEDELVEELSQLVHLSPYSDAFGFDMVGWLPPYPGAAPQAICIEVKGSRDRTFHLSMGEWHRAGAGDPYGVLVVRRAARGGPPEALDLLMDPVHLVKSRQLTKVADGYVIRYEAA